VVKDLQGEFHDLLETAVTGALRTADIRRARDIAEAEVLAARDQFRALAEERALLLREVNHRVSNSLQLIASLLHFQADVSDSPAVKAALKEANGRVMAVARVHRWLYVSEDVRSVSLADYLQTLIGDLDGVSSPPGRASSISLEADPVDVEPDKAVAVGIIATELILNALKHAYPDGTGPVHVRLLRKASGHAELTVEDEGVGNDTEGSPRMGLGRRIMAGMADKLDGNLTYNCGPGGTRATFSFPLQPRPVHLRQSA
jgi:two-component sensor histidine kinase